MDEIVKSESQALATLDIAAVKDQFVGALQQLSYALQQNLSPKEVAIIHDFTSQSKESIEAFKEIARERLLNTLLEQGTKVTDKGTLELSLGDGRVQRAIPTNTKPDNKLVERTIRNKGLSVESWMDREVTYKVNESKLKELVASKLFSQDDYLSCFKPQGYRVGTTQIVKEGDEDE